MSLVIISGNIDISVGALIGVLATISGSIAENGLPPYFGLDCPTAVWHDHNHWMGALVAYLRLPAIVVTLGL